MAMSPDTNLDKYKTVAVVAHYAKRSELSSCEKYLFDRHLQPGMAILDMGVGGGRTTQYLCQIAERYVGADYSEAMIDACRQRFPGREFRHCDARDMPFADGEFDAVVFSANGIDYIASDEGRARCLAEVVRVLKPGGVFIFSSHNARMLALWPLFKGARLYQILWRILRAISKSVIIAARNVSSGVYFARQGYIRDPEFGGFDLYVSTPETIAPQLALIGLSLIEIMGDRFPDVSARFLTPWYYYVCRKARNEHTTPEKDIVTNAAALGIS
jgi:ubiquinone/menaquinone biosynthesis C-methylase UbiE